MRVVLALGLSAGGVGRHVHGLAAGLAAAHEVVVAAPSSAEQTFGFAATGARVETVEVADRPDPRLDLRAVRDLRRVVRGADVVHAHGLRAGALACFAATGTGVPVVVTLHNAAPAGRVTGAVYGLLERIVARRAALVLGVSTDLVTRMQDLGSRTTGPAVVAAPPPPAVVRSREEVRAELGLSAAGTRLAVSVGRLAAQKNFGLLLDAVDRLVDLDVLLAVAGDGPDREVLEARIASDGLPVRLLGRRSDVPDLLAAADVVVSGADWEGQPVWLQEALLVGAPLVVTDAGGTVATIGGAAHVVPVGDAEALAAGIRAVLTDPAEGERLRGLSRAAADALPTEADAVTAAMESYRSVLGG